MANSKSDMIQTLQALKKQLNKLASERIKDASNQIDTYLKIVDAEQKRRKK